MLAVLGSPCRCLAAFWAKFWGAKAFWGLGQALVRVRRLQHTELDLDSEARASRERKKQIDLTVTHPWLFGIASSLVQDSFH